MLFQTIISDSQVSLSKNLLLFFIFYSKSLFFSHQNGIQQYIFYAVKDIKENEYMEKSNEDLHGIDNEFTANKIGKYVIRRACSTYSIIIIINKCRIFGFDFFPNKAE